MGSVVLWYNAWHDLICGTFEPAVYAGWDSVLLVEGMAFLPTRTKTGCLLSTYMIRFLMFRELHDPIIQ